MNAEKPPGNFPGAQDMVDALYPLHPSRADELTREGHALLSAGDDESAIKKFAESVLSGCTHPLVYEGYAQAKRNLGNIAEARHLLEHGLSLHPQHASLRMIRAMLLLGSGDFAHGWDDYEMRLHVPQRCFDPREIPFTRWTGEDFKAGESILIWSEQGFGDEIMFASCVHDFFRRGQNGPVSVTLECSREVYPIFKRSFPWANVIPRALDGGMDAVLKNTRFDYEIPIGSLPGILRRSRESFRSAQLPYLRAEDGYESLENYIALSWRGGVSITRQKARSLKVEDLETILKRFGSRMLSVQHDVTPEEINYLSGYGVRCLRGPSLDTILTAIDESDMLLTVCNTNVHLAGALDKKCFVLTPFIPEWRYGYDRRFNLMTWYDSVNLLRQEKYGDWSRPLTLAENMVGNFLNQK